MGWYDAYRKDNATAAVLNTITSDSGSGAKHFGDAFVDFSKSLMDSEDAKDKSKLVGLQTTNEQNKLDTFTDTKNQQQFDDAFSKSYLGYKNKAEYDEALQNGTLDVSNVSPTALKQDAFAQGKFNDEAIEQSVIKPYKDMQEFVTTNPELVKNADGVTMSKIEKYFSGKDTTLATLSAKEKEIKNATALAKMQAKLVKAQSNNNKDAFKYTEKTDAKIASQVKTAMGMDVPDFSFSDATKKEYEDAVSGSAKISKQYNLEPSLAIHVYQNPDLYEFTADGKVITKKPTVKEVKKTNSWKDYQ